ncbi:uncharacterized protein MAL13P1.304-like [Pectinophora gossypiella]|uniref:uncharacterized protein MAL13P1.304-like n=1 Tax=Pectinophora gossypiella TaxID=13191 RepID=UPI00214E2B1E|nr:uncharacterized protein MAL13P1.304-like [Pectinophora gossypiella]
MALQKLPNDIQSLLCTPLQIHSFKKAIEELVYNSLDADSTSIAIRVNIVGNSIQVIDNGSGISKVDFILLGERHATSKCVDLASLKSAPNKYGFRGLSLATIMEVSHSVTITSRLRNAEETWIKSFYKGKEQKCCQTSQRPSKGTTHEYNQEENYLQKNKIPTYFIFINCPYYDYDVNYTAKQSLVEFKNWEQINKLLEKLANFYAGDVNLKEIKPAINQANNVKNVDNTRDHVKKIMEKILESHHKKLGISQMQKGIKGKLVKRKDKKKQKLSLSKIILNKNDKKDYGLPKDMPAICVIPSDTATSKTKSKVEDCERKQIKANKIMTTKNQIQLNPKIAKVHSKINEKAMKNRDHDKNKLVNVVKDASKNKQIENNIAVEGRPKLRSKTKVNKHDRKSKSHKSIMCAKKIHKLKKNVKHVFKSLNDIDKQNIDVVLKKFNEDPTGSIKKRCNMLEQKVDDLMRYKKNRKRKIFINETVHYSNVIRNNKNYSIRKKVGEIVIHDYVPLPPKFSPCSLDNRVWDKIKNNPHKSSYDLVKTIFKTQETIEERNQITPRKKIHLSTLPKLPNTISAKPRYIEYEESSQMKPTINPRVDVEEGKQIAPSDDMQLSTLSNLPNDISLRTNIGLLDLNDKQVDNETYTIDQNDNNKSSRFGSTYMVSIDHSRNNVHNQNFNDPGVYENVEEINRDLDRIYGHSSQYFGNTIRTENVFNDTYNNGDENNMNIVFISKSQEDANIEISVERHINPLAVCETVQSNSDSQENANITKFDDSLFNGDFDIDSFLCDRNAYSERTQAHVEDNNMEFRFSKDEIFDERDMNTINTELANDINNSHTDSCNDNKFRNGNENQVNDVETFNFNARLRFLPKGMSQIFKNCPTKNIGDYNLDKDYYEEDIYNNFVKDIELHSKIFEPDIQNVKEITTKAIDKVYNKLNKDNASLIFSGESIKRAKVFGQIDKKFIAARISGRSHQSLKPSEYLVLFDQHAVHERIRLENHLKDYLKEDQWKKVTLDGINISVSKNVNTYLHNYEKKFAQLGLQWTILNDGNLSINAIPEAILGKNPRQVDVVIKAVKNLITEEISSIKTQRGCISLYPKAIMDLVFSESCRYAIKFGDKLSTKKCEELLNALSGCKTPFQCAHGRPVMAVIMNINSTNRDYKVD